MRTGRGDMSAQERQERQHSEARYLAAVREFKTAVRYFQMQKFKKAKEIFKELVNSPAREVAARARVHLRLCEQKLEPLSRPAAGKTVEDFYTLGVVELNVRNLDLAIEYLSKADKLAPDQEHIRYALAAAHSLQGNVDVALEHLSAAIALRPDNRFQARRDSDFQSVATDPRFKRLVSSEASGGSA